MINHGSTSTLINADGTHSTIHDHGNVSTVVNSEGEQSAIIKSESTATVVNTNDYHPTIFSRTKRNRKVLMTIEEETVEVNTVAQDCINCSDSLIIQPQDSIDLKSR
jgi:hypothetical protein